MKKRTFSFVILLVMAFLSFIISPERVEAATSVTVSSNTINLDLNNDNTYTLTVSQNYSKACYLQIRSKGTQCASITDNGWNAKGTAKTYTFKGQKSGSFLVGFQLYDSATNSVVATSSAITVNVCSVDVSTSNLKLDLNGTKEATIIVTQTYPSSCYMELRSKGSQCAGISDNGWINNGTAKSFTIRAREEGKFQLAFLLYDSSSKALVASSKVVTINVVKSEIAVTGISIDDGNIVLSKTGATRQLHATVIPSNATNKSIKWTSSDTAIATVSASGVVKAVKNGKTYITATSSNGKKVVVAVTVNIPASSTNSSNNKTTSKTTASPKTTGAKTTTPSKTSTVTKTSTVSKASTTSKPSTASKPSTTGTASVKQNDTAVKDRLDRIMAGKLKYKSANMKLNTKFKGTNAKEQCKGFAKNVFYLCFKVMPGSTKKNKYKLNLVKGMREVSSATNFLITAADSKSKKTSVKKANAKKMNKVKNMFSKARVGDFVQMQRGHGGPHSAIVYRITGKDVTFFEANTDGKNTVKLKTYTWAMLCSKNKNMTVYTATSYKLK